MEYSQRDPSKPVRSVIFYTDTFNLKLFFCSQHKMKKSDFKKIKVAIKAFKFLEKVDTSVYSYYNVTISDSCIMNRYVLDSAPATAKLFDSIVKEIRNVKVKADVKEDLDEIKSQFR